MFWFLLNNYRSPGVVPGFRRLCYGRLLSDGSRFGLFLKFHFSLMQPLYRLAGSGFGFLGSEFSLSYLSLEFLQEFHLCFITSLPIKGFGLDPGLLRNGSRFDLLAQLSLSQATSLIRLPNPGLGLDSKPLCFFIGVRNGSDFSLHP